MALAYAVYFDHKRRNSPEFRKQLRRSERRQARVEKEEAHMDTIKQRQAIKEAVDQAREDGFPTSVEDKEAYFLDQVSQGETIAQDRKRTQKPRRHAI